MKGWKPVDYFALLLVLSLVYVVVMMGVLSYLGSVESSPEGKKVIAQFLAGVTTLVSMYFGAKLNGKDDDE